MDKFWHLKDEFLIDDFLADSRLEIARLQESQKELVDQLETPKGVKHG